MANLKRKAMKLFEEWHDDSASKALLVDGARQVGKTYLIREFARAHYESLVEINLVEQEGAAQAFRTASDSAELMTLITLYAEERLVEGSTLIFIDEVQEAPEMITAAKFLVDKKGSSYDFVFSGSLLGVELKGIKSWPVGYLREITMYPLDFQEFCWASMLEDSLFDQACDAILAGRPVLGPLHERLLTLFYRYLAVGGMPAAVSAFADTGDLRLVRDVQNDIIAAYRHDIAKYCKHDPLFVKDLYDAIPSQLNSQSKRYVATTLGKHTRIQRDENKLLWLLDAGVAIACYNVEEPRYPLALAANRTLFKLFMNDVGLLGCASGMETVRKTMAREATNYGAIYENYVAQALVAQDIAPYYFRNKKMGELDFVVQSPVGKVLPIEVKSGKDYKRHAALKNVLSTENYDIDSAVVLYDGNTETEGKVTYVPIYAAMLIGRLLGR